MRTARLRVLDPCSEDYEAMRGSGTTRFCDRCSKNVTNLSDMTRADAQRFLEAHAGERVCVRYRSRDGELQFKPSVPARLGFVAALSFALAACTGYVESDDLDSPEDALVCHDAFGYAVPCEQLDDGVIPVDDAPPAADEGGDEVTARPVPPPPPEPDEVHMLGQVEVDPAVGCPIPPPDPNVATDYAEMGEVEVLGDIVAPPRVTRRVERAQRRAERAQRRLARRQR